METQSHYRETLETLLIEITTELETFAIKNSHTGDWEVAPDTSEQPESDENSEADAAESLAEETASLTELETSYRNIIRALQKLETGTFGTCEVCGATIAAERLAILPHARTCTQHLDEERALPL